MKEHNSRFFASRNAILRNAASTVLLFVALLFCDVFFRLIYKENDAGVVAAWVPLMFSVCWCAMLCCISLLLPRIVRRIYNILITVLYAVCVLVHAFFHSFFGTYMSFSSIMFANEGANFFDWSYFQIPKKLIASLILCILVAVISAVILPKTKYHVIKAAAIVLVFAASIVGVNLIKNNAFSDDGGITWDSVSGVPEIYDAFSDTYTCMHMTGLYQYTFRDFSITTGLDDKINSLFNSRTVSELDDYYAERTVNKSNEMTGAFKGKNLILIQLESIDTWMLNDIAMPNLSKIRSESIDFTQFYAPKYLWGATFNTENIVNTGLISPVNSSKVSYFTETYYPFSAANLFKKEGYDVNSFHRSNANIYNRGAAHMNWGYSSYNSGPALKISDYDLDSNFIEAYDKMVSDDKFMTFFITYSGHGPFSKETKESVLYYDMLAEKLPKDSKEEYICAMCHAYETDLFIGELFERLEADGHIDDTVVIFYTDHYNHYITDSELLSQCKGTDDTYLMCNIPFFIYSKDTPAEKIDKAVASYDILPTIANLFDLDTDGRYYMGDDAFSEGGGYVIFPDGSWYDGETYFKAYQSPQTKESAARAQEITKRLNASWNTVKTDYFKTIDDSK